MFSAPGKDSSNFEKDKIVKLSCVAEMAGRLERQMNSLAAQCKPTNALPA